DGHSRAGDGRRAPRPLERSAAGLLQRRPLLGPTRNHPAMRAERRHRCPTSDGRRPQPRTGRARPPALRPIPSDAHGGGGGFPIAARRLATADTPFASRISDLRSTANGRWLIWSFNGKPKATVFLPVGWTSGPSYESSGGRFSLGN